MSPSPTIACFLATSGHSGVDRIAKNLLPALAKAGYAVDLLKIRRHGPNLPADIPGLRVIEFQARHVYTAFPELLGYLRSHSPEALLTDKDRVNRTAIFTRLFSGAKTRLAVRLGTTVSVNLASRGWLERWVQTLSMRFLYRRVQAILMPSADAADDFAHTIGIPRERVSVVRSPIVTPQLLQLAEQPPTHPWLSDKQSPVILGVGELSSRKDFATLVRAFALLRDQRECRLIILGRGRQRDRLLGLAEELGVAQDVDLPGFSDNPYSAMRAADLFVLSSRWEGLAVALVEALALGTPTISTDCPGGSSEVLQNGRYGPLVPVGDAPSLAKAMQGVLDAPLPAETLRQAAVPYSLENSVADYLHALGFASSPESRDG
jgi:glycosyltransferase involved in cell wall biosynthesis